MSEVADWVVRYGHVLGAAIWTGDYALLAFVLVPALGRDATDTLRQAAIAAVRTGTYAGTLVIGFGVVLISRTDGYGHLFDSGWGALVLASAVIAVVLFAVGDGALRPALLRLAAGEDGSAAQCWAFVGLGLTVLAIGLMTGAATIG